MFPGSPLGLRVELKLAGTWVDVTEDVYAREDIAITRGRADEGTSVDPGTCSLVLRNRSGKYSPRNPRSPYYGLLGRNTPLRVGVVHRGEYIPRFCGEVSAWPARWDPSGEDAWVPIEASGILRRLGAAVAPLRSALVRFVESREPLAYWPLTDGEDSREGAAHGAGKPATTRVYAGDPYARPRWADAELDAHLEPVMRLPSAERGVFRMPLRAEVSAESWAVDVVRSGVGGFDTLGVDVAPSGSNPTTQRTWFLGFDHTSSTLYVSYREVGTDTSSISVLEPDFSVPAAFADTPSVFRLEVRRTGASSTAWRVYRDGALLRSGNTVLPAYSPREVSYEWWVPDDNTAEHVALGHVAVWDADTAPSPAEVLAAFRGFAGERAGRRIERVCAEQGIELLAVGDLDNTQLVGAQEIGTPLEVLESARAADNGILYEDRAEFRLAYRTNRSRYNRGRELSEG